MQYDAKTCNLADFRLGVANNQELAELTNPNKMNIAQQGPDRRTTIAKMLRQRYTQNAPTNLKRIGPQRIEHKKQWTMIWSRKSRIKTLHG